VHTAADPHVLKLLLARLERLHPDTRNRWGTLTAAEMLCHLGDAHEAVLSVRIPADGPPIRPRTLARWIALYTALPWARGMATRPGVDPRRDGTRPGDFEQDRRRALDSLRQVARATADQLPARHRLFGPMSAWDWHRWAYRHVNHHLVQFGL